MTSQSHSDQLLDLLYGELSPSQEAELRQAIADDDELAATWQELCESHGEIQTHIPPPQEVPSSVQSAILAAAAEHTASTGPKRRSPKGENSRKGLWNTLITSGNAQAAVSLAAVLACIGVVITMLSPHAVFDEPDAPVQSISVAQSPGMESMDRQGAMATEETEEDRELMLAEDEMEQEPLDMLGPSESPSIQRDEPGAATRQAASGAEQQRHELDPEPPRVQREERMVQRREVARPSAGSSSASGRSAPTLDLDLSTDAFGSGAGLGGSAGGAPLPPRNDEPSRAAPSPQAPSDASQGTTENLATDEGDSRRGRTQTRSALADSATESTPSIEADAEVLAEAEEMAVEEAEDSDDDTSSLIDEAEDALAEGRTSDAAELLDEALQDEDLPVEQRRRARSLRRNIDGPTDDAMPASADEPALSR